MRALVVHPGADFSVADVHRGWCNALRSAGVQVAEYNMNDRIKFFEHVLGFNGAEVTDPLKMEGGVNAIAEGIAARCYSMAPDIVIIISSFFVPQQLIQLMRAMPVPQRVVAVFTESPYEDDRQLEVAAELDACVLNDPINLDRFIEVCPTSMYLPHCYDPEVHTPGPVLKAYKSDAAWVGTAYQSRIDFLEQVDFGDLDVILAGNWKALDDDSPLMRYVANAKAECLFNDQTVEVYRSTQCSWNTYRKEANAAELSVGWAMGPREVELAAIGTFFARESRGEGDDVLPMLPIIDTPDDLSDILRWAIDNPEAREAAAQAARAAVADRTFDNNVRTLLAAVGF